MKFGTTESLQHAGLMRCVRRCRNGVAAVFAGYFSIAIATATAACSGNIPPSNPDSAYSLHGDGTATDTRTLLMWKVCAEGQTWGAGSCSGANSIFTWNEALAHAEAHSFAGHTDWRLPSLKELRTLVEDCRADPSINVGVFPSTSSSRFWSGSPNASFPSYSWYVEFYHGTAYANSRVFVSYNVRLVRGGPRVAF